MRIRRRGTRSAVKGQLTVIAMTIMAVVFLILAAVTQTISTASQQDQRTMLASSGENLAQTAAAWLTNHLNSDPNYIADGSGPFSIDGTYTPPIGGSSVTHGFVSEWFQFGASGHYQSCNTNLVQSCVRFDPATARFSTAYNPASTAIPTSLKEENVVATVEVEQGCTGAASGCKDSYYSTTIARRGYYNYLAFTNYATLDPAQYSPLGLVNPGSICQTNNAASGCVPVSYQSNGTPSPNGIYGGGSQTAPVFSGGGVEALVGGCHCTAPISPWSNWNGAMTFGTGNGQFQIYHNSLIYRGTGTATPEYIFYSPPINVAAGTTYDFSANIDASNVPVGSSVMAAVWNNASIGTTATILYQNGGNNGMVSGQFTPGPGVTQVAVAYQIDGPVVPAGKSVVWSQAEVIPASVGPNSLYQANINANQNLVPDSSLAFARSPINPTWDNGGDNYNVSWGTGPGQWSVSGNSFVLNGSGSSIRSYFSSQRFPLLPNTVYTISAKVNLSFATAGDMQIASYPQGLVPNYGSLYVQAGQSGTYYATFETPTSVSSATEALIASQGLVIPSGSAVSVSNIQIIKDNTNNLVFDSSLSNATSPTNPTWVGRPGYSPQIGTANGDFNALNPGTNKAKWVYYGTGSSEPGYAMVAQPVSVIPGDTYVFSANMNASDLTNANMDIQLYNAVNASTAYSVLDQPPGASGVVSGVVTIPAGVTTVYPAVQVDPNGVVTSGGTISWSQIQLTQTSSVQSYQPGPPPVTYSPGPLYTSSSNVTLQTWADVPSSGESGFIAFSGSPMTGFGLGIGDNNTNAIDGTNGFQVIALYQNVRWIPTGFDVTPGWHQFSLVLNASGQPSVYVDGILIYSDTSSYPITPAGPVRIGTDGNYGRYYSGAIADVSVYNQALTANQILDQYNAGSQGSYDAVVALDNPVGFWEMSDPPGSAQMPDASMNNNIGANLGNIEVVQPGPFGGGSQAITTISTANNGDSLYGALRTNSPTIFVCDGNSSAFDVPLVQATSARVMTATQPGCGLPSSATTVAQQVSPMAMPTNVSALAQAAFPYIFPDGTSFDFTPNGIDISFTGSSSYMTNNWPALDSALTAANTVVLMSGSLVSIQNMAIPSNGVLYVNGNVSNVVGVVNGQVTIAAEGNIDVNAQPDATVGENLYYYCNGQSAVNPQVIPSGCTDLLGLDAQGSIAIGPQSYQQTGWAYYGTGSAAGWTWAYSPNITVTPGETYTVSAAIDASAASPSGYPPYIGVLNDALTTGYAVAYQTPGANGMLSATFTDPAGVTQVRVLADTNNVTVDNGKAVVWSNATVTQQGSATNLVQPMSSWALAGTFGTSPGDWNLVPSELPPMVVDAAMTALGNSPGVVNSNGSVYATQWQTPNPNKQNPSCLIDAPSLTINGAMISQYQGTFGQYLGLYPSSNPCLVSGYHKHFFWDGRLAYEQPPFALSPGSGNFVEMGLTEVSRP